MHKGIQIRAIESTKVYLFPTSTFMPKTHQQNEQKNTFLREWTPIKRFLQVTEYFDSSLDSNSGFYFNSYGGYDHPHSPSTSVL